MKTFKNIINVVFIFSLAACDLVTPEDEEPTDVYEKISGTWTITKMNMLGAEIPGDGSTLTFEYCDEPPCTGVDYEAAEGTSGTFTYEFSENEQKVFIIDEDAHGGNYNTTWDILDFESRKLRMTGDFSIFGSMLMEMSK